jgi:HK97 family phage portal protein
MSILTRVRDALTFRVSPENPNTNLANPAAWLYEAFGATKTWSGNDVTEATALHYSPAWACINVLAKDLAQLPVFVYKRSGKARDDAREHKVWTLLHDRPNPWMTPFTFKQTLMGHAVSWGNGYAEIEHDGAGRPVALWPLLPDRTRVEIRNGQKWFVTRVESDKWVALAPERVLHVMGLGSDGIRGYSVIKMARNAIGMGMAVEEFTARLFSNGATPRYALKHPAKLSKEAKERLRISFDAAYTGLSNAHRTAVFEEGLELEKLGMPAKDAEMIESSKFGIEQMARFFDIPLMRLHSTTPITSWGTGLEQWQRAYLIHTLGPWIVQAEEAFNWSLFSESERPTHFAEFKREALLQADHAGRGAFYSQIFQLGAISPNEIAQRENLPQAGPEGDKRFVQGALVPLEDAGKVQQAQLEAIKNPPEPAEPVGKKEPEEKAHPTAEIRAHAAGHRRRTQTSYRRIFEQAAERTTTKQVQRARRQVEKLEKDGNVSAFQDWARDFFKDERSSMAEMFLPAVIALHELTAHDVLHELGRVHNGQFDVQRFSQEYVTAMATRETVTSAGALIKITQDGDTPEGSIITRLVQKLDDWTANRPKQIARHEVSQAGNAMARHIYEQAGVERLVWVSTAGSCEMCSSMDGRVVSINRPFVADGETVGTEAKSLTADGSISHPPLHKGCDCQLVAA